MRIAQFSIHNFVALIAVVATGALAQAQQNAPQRQVFPWSSSVRTPRSVAGQSSRPLVAQSIQNAAQNAAQNVTQSASPVIDQFEPQIQQTRNKVANRVSEVKNLPPTNEVIYLDGQGNEISYEKFQAQLTNVEHTVSNALPSHNPPNQIHQGYPTIATNPHHGNSKETVWRKTQNAVSNVTSIFKKPSLFEPTGFTLPSQKTVWGKPRFNAPSTWFSRTNADPITFAPVGTLPRHGQVPASTANTTFHNSPSPQRLTQHALPFQQSATKFTQNVAQTANTITDNTISNAAQSTVTAAQSVWDTAADRAASIIDRNSDFEPLR